MLRFWFDRGVSGSGSTRFLLVKDPELAEVAAAPLIRLSTRRHPEIYRSWRAIADATRSRVLVGEVWLRSRAAHPVSQARQAARPSTDFLVPVGPGKAARLDQAALAAHAPVDAPATWVIRPRETPRHALRPHVVLVRREAEGVPTDLAAARAERSAALLALALPGSFYVYQGEELGLPEVEDIPHDRRRDPMWHRSNGVDPGRDGCRIPLPWSGQTQPYGFSPAGAAPSWLEQPANWGRLTVEAEARDAGSMLALYRAGLRLLR